MARNLAVSGLATRVAAFLCTRPQSITARLFSSAAGLLNVRNTVVGDAELRGVSGGQKRRVTVGEKFFDEHSMFFV